MTEEDLPDVEALVRLALNLLADSLRDQAAVAAEKGQDDLAAVLRVMADDLDD